MLNLPEFKRVFDQIGTALMLIDVSEEGELSYALFNQLAIEFFGVTPDAYLGKKIQPYFGNDIPRKRRREKTIAAYETCIKTRQAQIFEVEHIRPDGETRWGRHTIAPALGNADRVSHLIVTSIDVTELVLAQKQLEDALAQTLSDYVSICAQCKNIKSDDQWMPIDAYAAEKMNYHSFSHGLCPDCVKLFDD